MQKQIDMSKIQYMVCGIRGDGSEWGIPMACPEEGEFAGWKSNKR